MIPFFCVGGKFITSTSINSPLWPVSDNYTPRCRFISCSLKICSTSSRPHSHQGLFVCVCFLRSNWLAKSNVGPGFNWLTTKLKAPAKRGGSWAEVELWGSKTRQQRDRDLWKLQLSFLSTCTGGTWVIDCTLMSGARSLICHHPMRVSSIDRATDFQFWVNICKLTINVAIIFEYDWLVSWFGLLLQQLGVAK